MSDVSTTTIIGTFSTREEADLAVEHLVQKFGIERSDVFVEAASDSNTSGTEVSGGDAAADPQEGSNFEPAMAGEIKVSACPGSAPMAQN